MSSFQRGCYPVYSLSPLVPEQVSSRLLHDFKGPIEMRIQKGLSALSVSFLSVVRNRVPTGYSFRIDREHSTSIVVG